MEHLVLHAGSGGGDDDAENAIEREAVRLLSPCLEAAAILAAEYASSCGREVVTCRDFELGLKFSARHVLGRQLESFFSDDEADDGDDEDDDVLSVDEAEEAWTRYDGDDPRLRAVNAAPDTWDAWVPETPLERALKQSIDNSL